MRQTIPVTADFTFVNHGSLWLLHPNTDDAAQHLRDVFANRPEVQWFMGGVAVEPRYVVVVGQQLRADGFIVR